MLLDVVRIAKLASSFMIMMFPWLMWLLLFCEKHAFSGISRPIDPPLSMDAGIWYFALVW